MLRAAYGDLMDFEIRKHYQSEPRLKWSLFLFKISYLQK